MIYSTSWPLRDINNFETFPSFKEDYLIFVISLIERISYWNLKNFTILKLLYNGFIVEQNNGIISEGIYNYDGNSTKHGYKRWEGLECKSSGHKFKVGIGSFSKLITIAHDNTNLSIGDCMDIC